MKISCEIDKSLPNVVRETAVRRVATKLSRFENSIDEVKLMLKDINGPRGGVDTECLVSVRLRHMPDVIIQERAESIGKALYNALERAVRNVAKSLERKTQEHQKKSPKLTDSVFAR